MRWRTAVKRRFKGEGGQCAKPKGRGCVALVRWLQSRCGACRPLGRLKIVEMSHSELRSSDKARYHTSGVQSSAMEVNGNSSPLNTDLSPDWTI